jgi:hypothetical protein
MPKGYPASYKGRTGTETALARVPAVYAEVLPPEGPPLRLTRKEALEERREERWAAVAKALVENPTALLALAGAGMGAAFTWPAKVDVVRLDSSRVDDGMLITVRDVWTLKITMLGPSVLPKIGPWVIPFGGTFGFDPSAAFAVEMREQVDLTLPSRTDVFIVTRASFEQAKARAGMKLGAIGAGLGAVLPFLVHRAPGGGKP